MTTPRSEGFGPVLRLPAFRQLWLSQLLAADRAERHPFCPARPHRAADGQQHAHRVDDRRLQPAAGDLFFSGRSGHRSGAQEMDHCHRQLAARVLAFSYILLLNWLEGNALLFAVYVITFLGSSVGAFFNPAVLAKIPLIVGERRLMVANSLFNLTIAGAQFLGLLAIGSGCCQIRPASRVRLDGLFYLLAFLLASPCRAIATRACKGVTAVSGWKRMRREFAEGWGLRGPPPRCGNGHLAT